MDYRQHIRELAREIDPRLELRLDEPAHPGLKHEADPWVRINGHLDWNSIEARAVRIVIDGWHGPGTEESGYVTALHELGHAATLGVTVPAPDPVSASPEALLGAITPERAATEIAAWEWAIPRIPPHLSEGAVRKIRYALDTYGFDSETIERVVAPLLSRPETAAA